MDIKIVKRDGSIEPFNIDKIIASIARSGVPLGKSEEIAKAVQEWIPSQTVEGKITSNQIRDQIIQKLSDDYPAEVDSYKAFKKEEV
jgi:transcriptional regulator NrdR family protein